MRKIYFIYSQVGINIFSVLVYIRHYIYFKIMIGVEVIGKGLDGDISVDSFVDTHPC